MTIGHAQQPVFRGGANFVLLDAYPRKDGRIVEGLAASDFQVLEDGKPQAIETIEFVHVGSGAGDIKGRDPNSVGEMRTMAGDPHRRVFITFLDTLHTTVAESHDARAPLIDALNRIVGPDDLFGVVTQDMRPQDLTLGRGLITVADQLTRYWTWGERERLGHARISAGERALTNCFQVKHLKNGSSQPWLVNDDGVRRFFSEVLIDRRLEDEVLTALEALVDYAGQMREARTALMILTDGWRLLPDNPAISEEARSDARATSGALPRPGEGPINGGGADPLSPGAARVVVQADPSFATCLVEATRLATIDEPRRFRELIDLAGRRNVAVYPVAMSGLAVFDPNPGAMSDMAHLRDRASALRTIAENTGGIAVVNTNDIVGGFRRIADDLSTYYLLGYYSTNTKMDGRLRRIDVKRKPAGLTVHARSGYFAPTVADMIKAAGAVASAGSVAPPGDASPVAAADALLLADALGPLGRLRESSDVFVSGVRMQDELVVAVELSARQTAMPGWASGAKVAVQGTDGGGAPLDNALADLTPGARGALVRIPVGATSGPWRFIARVTGGDGAVSGSGEIRPTANTLVGDPMLFRATPSQRSPVWPVADLQYRYAERLHAEWPVLQPLDRREARLLDRLGHPLPLPITVTTRSEAGRDTAVVDLLLAPLAGGDYVLDFTAARGTVIERKLSGFRVVR